MRRSLLIIAASTLGLAGCFGAPAPPPPQGVPPQLGPPPNPTRTAARHRRGRV